MPTKTYHGSCHCQAVTYQVELDLSQGTGKCNCSICWKKRNWSAIVKPAAFRVLSGEDQLSVYKFNTQSGCHAFCKHCGVTPYTWGNVPEIGGAFVSIPLSALDDVTARELLEAPVKYMDGLHDNWFHEPPEARHL